MNVINIILIAVVTLGSGGLIFGAWYLFEKIVELIDKLMD